MANVAVLGSTGYTGMLLLRILLSHPNVERITPVSRSQAGKPIASFDPGLGATADAKVPGGVYVAHEELTAHKPDAIISALPHGAAAEVLSPLAGTAPIIDLSADFRLKSAEAYEKAYGKPHHDPDLLNTAVYGLCEVNREAIVTADLIANPGCYPTATLLPLLPFAADIRGPIIINAMSGISGAGRKAAQNLLFGERSENANAYSPGRSHRHVPEIEQQLSFGGLAVTTGEPALFFTPHLVPVKQGMAVTSVVEVNSPMTEADARQRVESAYETSAFVGLSARPIPEMRDVRNSNRCDIGLNMLDSTHLQLFSTIDNLYKGASGQAIQNLNLRLGFDERSGLRIHGEF